MHIVEPSTRKEGRRPTTAQEILDRIKHLIVNPPENSRVIEFTPEVAMVILDTLNKGNRNKKPVKISEYAGYMANGQWGLTGDTIKFGDDGLLKDGQNRLRACVLANVPFRSHVVFGIDYKLFSFMDIGRVRGHGDTFAIAGVPYSSDTSATVRWAVNLTSKNPLSREHITNDDLLRHYRDRFEDIGQSVKVGQRVRLVLGHPTGATGALHYLFSKRDQVKADEFFERWINARYTRKSCPVKALQEKLSGIKAMSNNRVHDGVRNALIIKAWNAFIGGRGLPADKLNWNTGDVFPAIEG